MAKQLAVEKMTTAALKALDEKEVPEGPFYDLIYKSIRGAMLDNVDSTIAMRAAGATSAPGALAVPPAAASEDVKVNVDGTNS